MTDIKKGRGASLSLVPRFVGLRIALSVRNEQRQYNVKSHTTIKMIRNRA